MGLGDCAKCIKYLLFVFNLIFCLIGLAILSFGIWVYVSPNAALQSVLIDEANSMRGSGIFLMIIGGIIAILGFLGCCGAIFENRVLLVLFFILMLIVFLCLLAAGVVALFARGMVTAAAGVSFGEATKGNNSTKEAVDKIQSTWDCCGWKNAERDYTDQGQPIPDSCFHNTTKTTFVSCSKRFDSYVASNILIGAISVFVAAVVALIGLVLSMMLCCAISDLA